METRPYDCDDDLIQSAQAEGVPRLRVYPWESVAVVIGRGGHQDLELITEAIAADDVPLFKRHGGGCSVVLDPGNLVISVALPIPGLGGIKPAFGYLSDWIANGFAKCGVLGISQEGVSDLVSGDRKIGGSCIYRTRGLLYYSTTVLVDPDFDLMERYLRHPPREPSYRKGRSHKDFTTSLRQLGMADNPADLGPALSHILAGNLAALFKATCR